MAKILILALHRKQRAPGQRFRHEQYLDFLETKGNQIEYSELLTANQDKVFYSSGNTLQKAFIGLHAAWKRFMDLFRARNFDYIFIYRDAFFFGTWFEKQFSKSKAKLIFDFDDSIWLEDENPNQSLFQKLKKPAKTNIIISYCDLIIAGNEYLANHAKKFNDHVTIIPTTIDLNIYQKIDVNKNLNKVCIGWSGSFSTVKHFESASTALKQIKDKFGNQVYIKLIGDGNYHNPDLGVTGISWKNDTEIEDLCEIDIGIMPLPDDAWSKGKCGLKGLQYMALEIPTIMSPVGVNSDIIQDGINGYLAATDEEWIEKISLLVESKALREKIGLAGRKTVEDLYSVEANKEKWVSLFE